MTSANVHWRDKPVNELRWADQNGHVWTLRFVEKIYDADGLDWTVMEQTTDAYGGVSVRGVGRSGIEAVNAVDDAVSEFLASPMPIKLVDGDVVVAMDVPPDKFDAVKRDVLAHRPSVKVIEGGVR